MKGGFRELLRRPAVISYLVAAQWLRVTFAALVPALLLAAADRGERVAGMTVAALAIGNVVSGPPKGMLVDRFGLRRPLLVLAAASTVSAAIVAVVLVSDQPTAALIVAAFLLGCSRSPVGTFSRLLWGRLIADQEQLRKALTFESALNGSALVLGPLLTSVLVLIWSPISACVAVAALMAIGAIVLAALPLIGQIGAVAGRGPRERLRPSFVSKAFIATAGLFAAISSLPLLFVGDHTASGTATLVSLMTAGAVIAAVGATLLRLPARPLVLAGPAVALLMTGALVWGASLPTWLIVSVFGAGCGIAEIVISVGFTISAPETRQAEALSWQTSAGSIGQAAGAAATGALVSAGMVLGALPLVIGLFAAAVAGVQIVRPRAAAQAEH
jgi:predicted MFS family arabinose efflux permease